MKARIGKGFRVPALLASLLGLTLLMPASQVQGGECGCALCTGMHSGPNCGVGFQLVERTIHVPTMVTERRQVNVTECRTEPRERTITVQKVIPEVQQVRDVYTVMVQQTQTRLQTYHVNVPVWREVVQNVTVQVPTQELRKATQRVCRQVQVQEMQSVTRDLGHWDEVLVDVVQYQNHGCGTAGNCGRCRRRHRGCGGCGCADACGSVGYDAGCAPAVTQQIQRVWKPDLVTEQIPVTVWRNEVVEEPYEYHVTVYHPEVRQQKVKVCEVVTQEKQQEVQVTVCVPERRDAVRNVTTYRTVSEPQVQRYTVQVPYTVQKEVDVQVCRLVPKTVLYRVPVEMVGPSVCGGCGGYGCGHCR
jgi:hypothetical protein